MTAQDSFEAQRVGRGSPAVNAFDITPDDNNELPYVTRGVYIGKQGNMRVLMKNDQDITFKKLNPGVIYQLAVKKVFLTGTDADDIIGLY